MKRQFKHKVTGITGELESGHLHFQRCSGNMCSSESISEVFVLGSSDWEEVVVKEYEILMYLNPDNGETFTFVAKNRVYGSKGSERTLHYAKYFYKVYSIKRLSDGKVFTVGDYVRPKDFPSSWHNCKIEDFKLIEEELIFNIVQGHSRSVYRIEGWKSFETIKPLFKAQDGDVYEGDSWFYVTDKNPEKGVRRTNTLEYRGTNPSKTTLFKYEQNAIDYLHTLKPLFKTVKNEGIYEGSEYWVINTATWSRPWHKKAKARTQIASTWVLFLTEVDAQEWAIMNKPCLSINEIAQVYKTANHYNSYKKEYSKQGQQLRWLVNRKL